MVNGITVLILADGGLKNDVGRQWSKMARKVFRTFVTR